jgi:hypothetical protein
MSRSRSSRWHGQELNGRVRRFEDNGQKGLRGLTDRAAALLSTWSR